MDEYRLKRALKKIKKTRAYHKYLHPGISPIQISDSCKFILENCDSSFLFDSILKSQELKILKGVAFKIFIFQQLKKDLSWELSCIASAGEKPLIILRKEHSQFPIDFIKLWMINNVLLLPSEY
jgi:Family of unknown function (DUF6876)